MTLKTNKILGIIILILWLIPFIFADDELADAYYQSGLSLFKQNKYEKAIEKFNLALSKRKDFPQVFFKLGECYEKLNNSKQAIQNYRLCRMCLLRQKNRTKEDNEMLSNVERLLDKTDTKGKEIKTIKNKYVSELQKIADECLRKKYPFFALRIYKKILSIDPNNKAILDAFAKVQEETASKRVPGDKPLRQIFNGEDMTGWTVPNIWLPLWAVQKPCLVFNEGSSAEPSLIMLEKPPPKNYILTFELLIDKRLTAGGYEISIAYAADLKGVVSLKKVSTTTSKIGTWAKIEFTKQGTEFKLIENSKVTKRGKIESGDVEGITIYAWGYIAKFKNITLQELE
ncbi:MAG: tetratricopeptide repeat protein [Planctomycetota bacterium]|nr:tetratricopeptide repeat protein [Planctomycetota bacterium]